MPTNRQQAVAEFRRIIVWIIAAAVIMVVGALTYLALTGDLTTSMIVATIVGVFVSVLLGCGLFAAAFFSDKSGMDQDVTDATKHASRED
jgi:flagellar basal body-associated protein FliL